MSMYLHKYALTTKKGAKMNKKPSTIVDSIGFEVALEVLGGNLQPYIRALADERKKPCPSQPFIKYCDACMKAISDLQDELMPNDLETIKRILAREEVFGAKPKCELEDRLIQGDTNAPPPVEPSEWDFLKFVGKDIA